MKMEYHKLTQLTAMKRKHHKLTQLTTMKREYHKLTQEKAPQTHPADGNEKSTTNSPS